MSVTIAHPLLAPRYARQHRHWVYADADQDTYERAAAAIGSHAEYLLGSDQFQSRVDGERRNFIAWTDRCLENVSADIWLTTPLYRNPHDNPLFLHYCWLAEFDLRLRDGLHDLLIVTASSGLAAATRALCNVHAVDCHVAHPAMLRLARAAMVGRATLTLAAGVLQLAWRMLLARMILGGGHRARVRGTEIMVDTYLLPGDLADDGTFRDRYSPGLVDYYRGQGMNAASYPLLYGVSAARSAQMFRRMKRSATAFVPVELFVTPADVLWALVRSLAASVRRARLAPSPIPPVTLGPVVEWHRPVTAMRGLLALVLARAPARLAASGVRPRWVIEWYENQPLDKAAQIGFAATGADVRVIALKQYPPSPNWLSLYTTTGEVAAGVAPRENWVCGRSAAASLAAFDSTGAYRVVPALRYAYLHSEIPRQPGRKLLALLPYARADARLILRCLFASLPVIRGCFDGVVIKPHPTVDFEHARSAARRAWPAADHDFLEWRRDPVEALLTESRVVVTADSSVALEAICVGRPVVVVGHTAGLKISVLDAVDGRLWGMVYDPIGLAEKLRHWSPDHPISFEERLARGRAIRNDFFEPVSELTMRTFLPQSVQRA